MFPSPVSSARKNVSVLLTCPFGRTCVRAAGVKSGRCGITASSWGDVGAAQAALSLITSLSFLLFAPMPGDAVRDRFTGQMAAPLGSVKWPVRDDAYLVGGGTDRKWFFWCAF
jgi:hypothetical protein